MTPAQIYASIRTQLIAHSEPARIPGIQRFFQEPIDAHGVYTGHLRDIAKAHGVDFVSLTTPERTELMKSLWKSGKHEEGMIAILLFARMRRKCDYCEWRLFSQWLDRYVCNWAHCDTLCADVLGPLLIAHPEWLPELSEWATAPAAFKRRAALVVPMKGIRKGMFRAEAGAILELLAADKEPNVKKGVVWLRKELAR